MEVLVTDPVVDPVGPQVVVHVPFHPGEGESDSLGLVVVEDVVGGECGPCPRSPATRMRPERSMAERA